MTKIYARYNSLKLGQSLLIMIVTFILFYAWTWGIQDYRQAPPWEAVFATLGNNYYLMLHYWLSFLAMLYLTHQSWGSPCRALRYGRKTDWLNAGILTLACNTVVFAVVYMLVLLTVNFVCFGWPDTPDITVEQWDTLPVLYSIWLTLALALVTRILSALSLMLAFIFINTYTKRSYTALIIITAYMVASVLMLYFGTGRSFGIMAAFKAVAFPASMLEVI